MTDLVGQRAVKVSLACRLLGHCRQAYYQSKADIESDINRESRLIQAVVSIRNEDPGIGCYKLWLMLCDMFGRKEVPGRDRFYDMLRRHHLMLPVRKTRCTTNSNHRYHKWKNLIKDFVPMSANELWVSDITYIPLSNGNVCYLHLVTDAYSHKIVGWELADNLRAASSIKALRMAIVQAVAMKGSVDLNGLTHHSDRGVQYCCDQYVGELQKYGISISMTEDYKPTDNAIAERANGIIKVESVYINPPNDINHARNVIGRFIHFYNYRRPHMSLNHKIPAVVHMEQGEQKKAWKKKNYHIKDAEQKENHIPLQSRTTSPGEGTCHQP